MCNVPIFSSSDSRSITLEIMVDGNLRLGQPEKLGISAIRMNADYGEKDKGKYLLSFKIENWERCISVVLNGNQIKNMTSIVWNEYLGEEKSKAIKNLKKIFPTL